MFAKVRQRKVVNQRRALGSVIAESAASMAVMIPLMVVLIFTTLEISYGCFLLQNLSQAARTAARDLAIEYGADPNIVSDRAKQDARVFDSIRLANVVNDSAQFDAPNFQTAIQPHTVTVTVHYTGGQYALPVFPYPDPLGIGQRYQVNAQSTFRLE